MLKSFLWIVGLVIIVLSIALFSIYSAAQVQSATNSAISQLRQASGSADILYDQMYAVRNTFDADSVIVRAMTQRSADALLEAEAVRNMRAFQSAHPYIRSSGVYNPILKRYISTNGVFTESEFDAGIFREALDKKSMGSFSRTVFATPLGVSRYNAHTFAYRVQTWQSMPVAPLIVIDISDDYLRLLIENILDEAQNRNVAVFDADSLAIAHGDRQLIMSSAREFPYGDQLIAMSGAACGSFTYRSGQAELLAFVRSPRSGWTFVSTQPTRDILGSVPLFGAITMFLAILLFLLGALISGKVSERLHVPIRRLYEQYAGAVQQAAACGSAARGDGGRDSSRGGQGIVKVNELAALDDSFSRFASRVAALEENLADSRGALRQACARYLLDGAAAPPGVKMDEKLFEKVGISLASRHFKPLIMEYSLIGQALAGADLLQRFALENIAAELLSKLGRADIVFMGGRRFAALMRFDKASDAAALDDVLEQIADVMRRKFDMRIICCAGDTVGDWRNVSDAYGRAELSMKRRRANWADAVLRAEDSPSAMIMRNHSKKLIRQISDALRSGYGERAADAEAALIAWLGDVSWVYAQNFSKYIMLTLLSEFESCVCAGGDSPSVLYAELEKVDACQTLDDIAEAYRRFASELMRRLRDKKALGERDEIRQVVSYIRDNYMDPDISLNSLSEMVGLTPAYLGKMLSSALMTPFAEYLNSIRLERAAALLAGTSRPISQISADVGILSANYFYSIFKKKYGTTPSKYRKDGGKTTM
ncbi:MAG: helix-turn-helix domain-containing protein [Clostridiales bacterium]|nr:helix-turn-helix domain-containing protein [Clostridiales bacterium]